MQFTNKDQLAVLDWSDWQKVMAAKWPLLVHFMRRIELNEFGLGIQNSIHNLSLLLKNVNLSFPQSLLSVREGTIVSEPHPY